MDSILEAKLRKLRDQVAQLIEFIKTHTPVESNRKELAKLILEIQFILNQEPLYKPPPVPVNDYLLKIQENFEILGSPRKCEKYGGEGRVQDSINSDCFILQNIIARDPTPPDPIS